MIGVKLISQIPFFFDLFVDQIGKPKNILLKK